MVDKRLLLVFSSPFCQISWILPASGLLDCWAPWRQESPLAQGPLRQGGSPSDGMLEPRNPVRSREAGDTGTWPQHQASGVSMRTGWDTGLVNRAHSQAGQVCRQLETNPDAWLLFMHYQVGHGNGEVTKLLAPCELLSCLIGAQVQWPQSSLQKDHSCVIVL